MARIAPFRSSHSGKAKARRVKEKPKQRHQQPRSCMEQRCFIVSSLSHHRRQISPEVTEDSRLAAAVSSKLEAGNFSAAIRIICSSDAPAQVNHDTLQALQIKHPGPAHNRRTPSDPGDNPRFESLQVSKEDVIRALRTFPLGSSGGPRVVHGLG